MSRRHFPQTPHGRGAAYPQGWPAETRRGDFQTQRRSQTQNAKTATIREETRAQRLWFETIASQGNAFFEQLTLESRIVGRWFLFIDPWIVINRILRKVPKCAFYKFSLLLFSLNLYKKKFYFAHKNEDHVIAVFSLRPLLRPLHLAAAAAFESHRGNSDSGFQPTLGGVCRPCACGVDAGVARSWLFLLRRPHRYDRGQVW